MNEPLKLKAQLKHYGLLCHTFSFNDLPESVQQLFYKENNADFTDSFLSLLANAGPQFWSQLKKVEPIPDAVDRFSEKIAAELIALANLNDDAKILYPGAGPAPLIQLGELAQWSTPSPLGLGLHKKYGPWMAYRALIKTAAPLTEVRNVIKNSKTMSPCLTCETTPCVSQCPANAVSLTQTFSVVKCADYRMLEQTTCAEQCHARNACPVGIEYRYSEEQRAYHMTHALQAMIRWAAN